VKAQRHAGRVVTSIPLGARGTPTTDLAGRKVIVSSGPIPQQLTTTGDVLSNFSSGLQGHEIACALADRGAQVVLITGPVTLADPAHPGVTTRHVTHVEALLSACLAELPADAYVGTAAVADFKVSALMAPPAPGSSLALPLLQTVDILNTLGHLKDLRPQVVVGFAAETRELLTYARDKLNRKGADVIFANSVGERPASTPSTHNRVYRVTAGETQDLGVQEKYQVGQAVADFIRDALEAPSVVSCASE
jgi:phosphopantothenoylcysteine decarboxylase/phosphopantothenate--cysteine ligase